MAISCDIDGEFPSGISKRASRGIALGTLTLVDVVGFEFSNFDVDRRYAPCAFWKLLYCNISCRSLFIFNVDLSCLRLRTFHHE